MHSSTMELERTSIFMQNKSLLQNNKVLIEDAVEY